jgi:hypothetical protein
MLRVSAGKRDDLDIALWDGRSLRPLCVEAEPPLRYQ